MKLLKNDLARVLPIISKLLSQTGPLKEQHLVHFKGDAEMVQISGGSSTERVGVTVMCEAEGAFDFGMELKTLREAVHQGKDKYLTLTGQAWDGAVPEPAPDDAFELKLPQGFVQMLAAAAPIVNRSEYRRVLQGINLSSCGITATDGRQLFHIETPLALTTEMTLPFPMALLASKSTADGTMRLWNSGSRRRFRIDIGNVCWQGCPLDGSYPNWKAVVPQEAALPNVVVLNDIQAEQLAVFLKNLPDNPPDHPVTLSQSKDKQSLNITARADLKTGIAAEFNTDWGGCEIHVNRNILQRALLQGHRKFRFGAGHTPFTAAGGVGEFIAMPLAVRPAIQPKQPQKEEPKMNVITPKPATVPVQSVPAVPDPELNPMEELATAVEEFKSRLRAMFEESAALSRKVKEVMLSQKQKERDFIQAKRAIERIRMAI